MLKFLVDELAVLVDQLRVEVELATPLLLSLHEHDIPMNGRVVAVGGLSAALSEGNMEGDGDLFVEEGTLHNTVDEGIDTQSEFAGVWCALVQIDDLVELVGSCMTGRVHNLTALELESDVIEEESSLEGGSVEGDMPVDGVSERGR